MKKSELERMLHDGLLSWIDIKKNAKILMVTDDRAAFGLLFENSCFQITKMSTDSIFLLEKNEGTLYDYIFAIKNWEKIQNQPVFLKKLYSLLTPEGKLFLGMNNRLGIRYFVGDRDPYTFKVFDGINNYRRTPLEEIRQAGGRLYAQKDMRDSLAQAGIEKYKFYSVFPSLEAAQMIYSEDYLPEERLSSRLFPMYNYPNTVFIEERFLLDDLVSNGLFHQMANAYMIECSKTGDFEGIKQATISINRGKELALTTIIKNNGFVEKKAIFPEGKKHLEEISEHDKSLKNKGINMLQAKMENDKYVMPYVHAITADIYLKNLFATDFSAFIKEADRFWECVKKSSDLTTDASGTLLMKTGWFDLIPLNCFVINGNYVFYDQEFCIENLPLNVLAYRMISIMYLDSPDMDCVYPQEKLFEHFGIKEDISYLREVSDSFTISLRNEKELDRYNESHGANYCRFISRNLPRMNWGIEDIFKIFIYPFDDIEGKEIVLYGAGRWCEKFLDMFGTKIRPKKIIDNSSQKNGTEISGIPVISYEKFYEEYTSNYKVIICLKEYKDVLRQLQMDGIRQVSLFNPYWDYQNPEILKGKILPLM